MRRPSTLLIPALIFAMGCGGSSSSNDPSPTGGGGRVADYVGTYQGEFSLPPDTDNPAGRRLGAVSLTVSSDGAVTGTRRDEASGTDAALVGSISDDGILRLRRESDPAEGGPTIVGSLAKLTGGRAAASLTEPAGGSGDEAARIYSLSGGSANVPPAPRTLARAILIPFDSPSFEGRWARIDRTSSGALSLSLTEKGRVSGSWNDPTLGVGTLTGQILANADTGTTPDPRGEAAMGNGKVVVRFPGGARRELDLRVVVPRTDFFVGPALAVGTATEVGIGTGEFSINLRTVQ